MNDSHPRRPRLGPILALLVAALASCGGSDRVDTIDRGTFIDTYVDLRVAALDTDSARIGTTERDQVLQRHGVTEDDLTTFADVHAADLDFMSDVWNEIEQRLDRTAEEMAADAEGGDEPEDTTAEEGSGPGDEG